jgi:hypothetical protein
VETSRTVSVKSKYRQAAQLASLPGQERKTICSNRTHIVNRVYRKMAKSLGRFQKASGRRTSC